MATKKAASCCVKLCPKCFGIAIGLIWGIYMLCASLLASADGIATGLVYVMGTLYIGYAPGLMGGILGLVYGFLDGFIGGYLVAWIYNKICKC